MTATNTALMLGAGALEMVAGGILMSGNSSVLDALVIKSRNIAVAPPVSTVISTSSSTGSPQTIQPVIGRLDLKVSEPYRAQGLGPASPSTAPVTCRTDLSEAASLFIPRTIARPLATRP
jgi:hypothetical protein